MFSLPLELVIERDPDSQGKEWSLWLGMVILMDTRLPSRQREGGMERAVLGRGVLAVREVMRTIHPLSDVSDTREVKKKRF